MKSTQRRSNAAVLGVTGTQGVGGPRAISRETTLGQEGQWDAQVLPEAEPHSKDCDRLCFLKRNSDSSLASYLQGSNTWSKVNEAFSPPLWVHL